MKTTTKSSVILFIILISVDFITFTISGWVYLEIYIIYLNRKLARNNCRNDLVEECGKVQTIGGSLVRFGQNTSMGRFEVWNLLAKVKEYKLFCIFRRLALACSYLFKIWIKFAISLRWIAFNAISCRYSRSLRYRNGNFES